MNWLPDLVAETVAAAQAQGISPEELALRLGQGWGLPSELGGRLPSRVQAALRAELLRLGNGA